VFFKDLNVSTFFRPKIVRHPDGRQFSQTRTLNVWKLYCFAVSPPQALLHFLNENLAF
jgi:hypothetical protein